MSLKKELLELFNTLFQLNRGFGISKGCSMTPSGLGHFESLKFVSKKIK